jgi:hypothetical protein
MTSVEPTAIESVKSECEVLGEQHPEQTPIDHILQRLSGKELPARDHLTKAMQSNGVRSLMLIFCMPLVDQPAHCRIMKS